MSFQDPDDREKWAKRAEQEREACVKRGGHRYLEDGRCGDCPAYDAKHHKPRVTLQCDEFRAVLDGAKGDVLIEQRSTDSLGGERWDVIRKFSGIVARGEGTDFPIMALLTKGQRP